MRTGFVSLLTAVVMIISAVQPSFASETYHNAYASIDSTGYNAYNTDIYKDGIKFDSNASDGFMYEEGAWVSYMVDFSDSGSDTLVMNMRPNVRNTQGKIGVYADSMETEPIAVFDQSANLPYGGYTSYAGPGYKNYYFSMSRPLKGKHTVYFKALSRACTYFKSFEFISSDDNITDCFNTIKPSDNPERLWGVSLGVIQENDGIENTSVLRDVRGCVYIPGIDFGNDPSASAGSVTIRCARWYETTENTGDYEIRLDGIDGKVIGKLAKEDVTYGSYDSYTIYFTQTVSDVHTVVLAFPDKTSISSVKFNKKSNVDFSWIGNSYSGAENENGMAEFILHDVASMYVSSYTGKLYTNVYWNEGGANFSEITDGKLTNIGYGSHGWGYEGGYAVTANEKYVFFGQSASYQGKDDGNWPEEGNIWFGVTRRLVSDITSGDDFEGMKMANGGSSGRYFLPIDTIPVQSEELTEGTVSGSGDCVIAGLAATETELFVSDAFYEQIKVYNAETMEYKKEWHCPNPGQMTLDSYGNLWVVQPEDNQIICFSTDGNPLRVISFASSVKLWSVAATSDGRLLIPDRGINENIMVYESLNKNRPVLSGYIGVEGGVFSGDSEAGVIGNERFYQISGIGADSENNIYVCNSGVFEPSDSNSFGTAFIESYSAENELRWRLYGLEFLDSAVADPGDPSSVYTKFERFSMDYSKEPGSEWEYAGYTLNPHKYPDDFRLKNNSLHVIAARTIDGVRMLFATDMYGYSLYAYRFSPETDGETAIPCMAVYDNTSERCVKLMQDTTGDGTLDSEIQLFPSENSSYIHLWTGWDIDEEGNIYNARNGDSAITKFSFEGFNENNVPVWSYSAEDTVSAPAPFDGTKVGDFNSNRYKDLRMSRYDAANDVMYLTGAFDKYNYNDGAGEHQMNAQSKSPGDTLARFENWSEGNREPSYIINFKYSKQLYQQKYLNLNSGFAICDGYIFVCESAFTELGAIHIYEAETGEWVEDIPYNSHFGETGLMDIVMPLSAVKISSNKYMILLEDDLRSKILTVYWQAPAEFTFYDTDFTEENGEVSVTANFEKTAPGSADIEIYFAVYDNKRLQKLEIVEKNSGDTERGIRETVGITFSNLTSGQEIKVMAWDKAYRPLKTAEQYFIK